MSTRPKKEITIRFNNADHKIVWYTGTSASDIKQLIRDIVGLSADSRFTLKDRDGAFIPVSGSMPTGEQGTYTMEIVRENSAESMPVKDRVELFKQSGGGPLSPSGSSPLSPSSSNLISSSPMGTLASKAAGGSALYRAVGEKVGADAPEVVQTAGKNDDDNDDDGLSDEDTDEAQSVGGPIGADCSIPGLVSFGVFTMNKESHMLQFDMDSQAMTVVRRDGQLSIEFSRLLGTEKDPSNAHVLRILLSEMPVYELWTQSAGEADTIASLVESLVDTQKNPKDKSRSLRWNFDVKLVDDYGFQPSLLYDPPRENSAKFLHAGNLEMCKNDAFYNIWAVVAPSRMYLFKNKSSTCPFNCIVLRDVRLSKEGDVTFEIKTNFQFFQFRVMTSQERESWLETLSIGLTSRNRTSFPMRKREAELKARLSAKMSALDVSDEGRVRKEAHREDPLSPPEYKLINEVSGNFDDGFLLCDELMDGADNLSVPRMSAEETVAPLPTTSPSSKPNAGRRKSSVTVITFNKDGGLPTAQFTSQETQVGEAVEPQTPNSAAAAAAAAAGAHYRSEVTLSRLKLNPGQVLKKKFMVVSFQVMKRNDRGKQQARVLQFDLFAKCLKNFAKEELKKAFAFDQFISISKNKEELSFSMTFRGNKPYEIIVQDQAEMDLMMDLFDKVVRKDVRILDPSLPFDPSPIRPKYVLLSDGTERVSQQTYVKAGFVDKKGSTGKNASRWMVVSDNRCYIFRNDLSLVPLNVIPLGEAEHSTEGDLTIKLKNRYREFVFRVRSQDDRDSWAAAFNAGRLRE